MNQYGYIKSLLYTFLSISSMISLCFGVTWEVIDIPMRDSILLKTTVYYPDTILHSPPWPCIIQRSPYNRGFTDIVYWTDQSGYVVVGQYIRGWGESQGIKTLFQTDGWGDPAYGDLRDSYDAIEWLSQKPWCTGDVGMYGFSAPAVIQYQAAGSQPPHLKCCNPYAGYCNPYLHGAWSGGEFRKGYLEYWCQAQNTPYFIDTVCNHCNYDSFYTMHNLAERWDTAHYPMYHCAGWYDMHLEGGLQAFSELQARFHNQKLLVGPWGHTTWGVRNQGNLIYPTNAVMSNARFIAIEKLWFDFWMKDSVNGITEPKVTFYLMGNCDTQDTTQWNRWVEADTWPLAETQYKNFYLHEGNLLDTLPPTVNAIDTFQYDPADPCESYGGKESWGLNHGYGPIDNQPIEIRSDVLVFSTPILQEPLAIIGNLRFTLFAASDCYDTDWTIRVNDVYPDGRSILITDGILMARHRHGFDCEELLIPGVPDTFNIDVGSTANVFAPGHRLRVIISSSNYPRFEKNPNTGAPFQRNPTNFVVATQQIFRSTSLPSHLVLPVYPELPGITEQKLQTVDSKSLTTTILCGVLQLPMSSVEHSASSILLDITGRKIMDLHSGANDIRHLAPGIYYIRNETNKKITKIIITK